MISYCVMVYNRWATMQHLIASLQTLEATDHELILVDLGSTDIDYREVLKASGIQSRLILFPAGRNEAGKINRSMGRNMSANSSRAKADDILFFLDADMLVPKNFNWLVKASVSPGNCFFPICYSLHEGKPREVKGNVSQWVRDCGSRANGWWRKEGWGNCGFTLADYRKLGSWNEEIGQTYGGEDNNVRDRAQAMFKMNRFNVPGFFHQWHPPNR